MSLMGPGHWMRPLRDEPDATAQVFLLPYSGAGISVYHGWAEAWPRTVSVYAVQLPGRQDRRAEPAFTELPPLLDALFDALVSELDGRPYLLFGHSMGALLGYRLAVALSEGPIGVQPPALIAMSGWAPKGFVRPSSMIRPYGSWIDLSADGGAGPGASALRRAATDWLLRTGALSPGQAGNPQVLALTVPVLLADVAVVNGYTDDGAEVACPIVSFSGKADPLMSPGAMASWSTRTRDYLGDRQFPGDHFFLHAERLAITAELTRLLEKSTSRQ